MKILLIAQKSSTREILNHYLKPRGFEFIHYQNPIKAMDNIEEVEPDLVLFSAEDFPRHWKPFIRLLRDFRSKEETVFILLKGDVFPFEEAAKASYLGVNGILKEALHDKQELLHLEDLFSRYNVIKEHRDTLRYIPKAVDEIEFIFTKPNSPKLITGKILDFSLEGLSFLPDNPQLTGDIAEGIDVPHCSFRIGKHILSVTCRIIRNSQLLVFKFMNLQRKERNYFIDYIQKRSQRELEEILHPAE
ncbi:MAG: PilZ domain-containing protein [Spirochaetales bacterium]|nr:PilZ domain-containing protein [Spirochaetales bacterium]